MSMKARALSLAISVSSLLYSNVFAAPLVANADVLKLPESPQIIAQKSTAPISSIEGIWQAQDKYRIQISQINGVYNGKIVWIAPGVETKDINNPDENLRSRDLIGVEMLKGFRKNPDKKEWTGGTIYAPDFGRKLNARLWITSENQINVKVSMGLMSKTMTLTAVK